MKERAGIREYDWWLLAIVGAICAMGVVEIYSATHNDPQPGTAVYIKQLWWLLTGVICMLADFPHRLSHDYGAGADFLPDRTDRAGRGARRRPNAPRRETVAAGCSDRFFKCQNWLS